jgi:HlyD family secretion protein
MRLADVSTWIIETDDLDELSVVNLSEGDTVEVSFDALPEFTITGTVANINEFGVAKQGAITYTAEIHIDSQDPRLRWNMSAAIRKESATAMTETAPTGEAQASR